MTKNAKKLGIFAVAIPLLGGVSARTGYADWYHDATTNYPDAYDWEEGNWIDDREGIVCQSPWLSSSQLAASR